MNHEKKILAFYFYLHFTHSWRIGALMETAFVETTIVETMLLETVLVETMLMETTLLETAYNEKITDFT